VAAFTLAQTVYSSSLQYSFFLRREIERWNKSKICLRTRCRRISSTAMFVRGWGDYAAQGVAKANVITERPGHHSEKEVEDDIEVRQKEVKGEGM
jgi:hypothetical protein